MLEYTKEKSVENGVKNEILDRIHADLCVAILLKRYAEFKDDIMNIDALKKGCNGGKFEGTTPQQRRWFLKNYDKIKKIIEGFVKAGLWRGMEDEVKYLSGIIEGVQCNLELRENRLSAEKKKRKKESKQRKKEERGPILGDIRKKIAGIMTPTPREGGDSVLRGMIDRHRRGEKLDEVTINSEEVFKWCLGVINEVKENHSEMLYDDDGNEIGEGVPKERISECEKEASDQLVPHISNEIDFSEPNARDFRIFLEERLFGDGKDGGVQAEIKFIIRAWTTACIENFPKKCGEIVTKLNQEACELRTGNNNSVEETQFSIKEMILNVLTLKFFRYPRL
jgi:hypothetical protein